MPPSDSLPVLAYLQKQLAGTLDESDTTHMRYPTAISQTLGIIIHAVDAGRAEVRIDADPKRFGNQQGTVHGGLLCELADAAIGTAHSTLMQEDESFASVEFSIRFFRPVWDSVLQAKAYPQNSGRTLTHYVCEITREQDGKTVAVANSTVMTLRGNKAEGR